MSLTKVEEFLNNVGEDQALQAELAKALEAENDREAVTALAKSKGYDFSSEELWAAIQKRQAEFSQKEAMGELSDEELEAVAGGVTPATGLVVGASALTYQITKDVKNKIKW
jgi:predicted ribosomally synthesized peptide with nif11-like leader